MAIVAVAAIASNAAAFTWSNTGTKTAGTIYDYTSTKVAPGTMAYLFDVATLSQDGLLTALREGNSVTASAVSSAQVNSSSKIGVTDFSYGTIGEVYNYYFAIIDSANDQVLISDLSANSPAQAADTTAVAFSGSATWSKNVIAGADTSYSTAGWYSTAVPEPTSGLLLLLGMAGLALRRKQA